MGRRQVADGGDGLPTRRVVFLKSDAYLSSSCTHYKYSDIHKFSAASKLQFPFMFSYVLTALVELEVKRL
jgi:hypothetical protein